MSNYSKRQHLIELLTDFAEFVSEEVCDDSNNRAQNIITLYNLANRKPAPCSAGIIHLFISLTVLSSI